MIFFLFERVVKGVLVKVKKYGINVCYFAGTEDLIIPLKWINVDVGMGSSGRFLLLIRCVLMWLITY